MTFGQTMAFGIVMVILWWGLKTVHTIVSWMPEVELPAMRERCAKRNEQKTASNNYKGNPGKRTIGFDSTIIVDKEAR